MTKSNQLIDATFKDSSPLKTVEQIKNILAHIDVKTEEIWHDTKIPYCYALTIKIEGLNFSVNGKGLSREFALASAYGELMERMQMGFIGKRATQKDGTYSMNIGQDFKVPVKQLLEENMPHYRKMAQRLFEWNGTQLSPESIIMPYADSEQNVLVTRFVNLMNGKTAYIPSQMRKAMYTSNGCAAGNTMEEAIVQSISEIVERYYRLYILRENISLPEIPEDVLKKYTVAYEIINYIRDKGYKVSVKDCSLNKKFPVVCVCFVHTKTGKYHTHFGAYPNFEIALTRAFTETFQGRDVDSFASFSDFFYNKNEKKFVHNMSAELVTGSAKRTPDFFIGECKYSYNTQVGFKGKNNKELLKECVEFFKELGYDILVRDSSGLGFPTYQVIIPGYSETYIHRLSKNTDENRYLPYAVRALRNLKKASMPDMLGFLMHHKEITDIYISHPGRTGFLASAKIMANLSKHEEDFLLYASMAYIHYSLGQLETVNQHVGNMLALKVPCDEELLICIKRYLDFKLNGYNLEQTKALLEIFHTKETLEYFYDCISSKRNLFDKFVLECDMSCSDSCILKGKCCQARAQRLIDLINEKTNQLNFESFADGIKKLLH